MLGVGFFELLLLFAVALLLLGPSRLLVAARYCGLFARRMRVLYARVMDELDQQLRMDEMARHSASTRALKKNSHGASKSRGEET